MKESRHANFGAIQAFFVQLSWSQHKLAHSCQAGGQRSNGAINRNTHLFRSFRRERETDRDREREREGERERCNDE